MNSKISLSLITLALFSSNTALAVHSSPPKTSQKKPIVPQIVQQKWRTFTSPDGSFTVLMSKKQHDSLEKTVTGFLNSFQLVVKR